MVRLVGNLCGWAIVVIGLVLFAYGGWVVASDLQWVGAASPVPTFTSVLGRSIYDAAWLWFLPLIPLTIGVICCPPVFSRLPLAEGFVGRALVAMWIVVGLADLFLAAGVACQSLTPRSQYEMALRLRDGVNVQKNYGRALALFRRAADCGLADAQNGLAYMLLQGEGTAKDPAAAVTWLRKAADQGSGMAMFNLAQLYQTGEGLGRDDSQAARLYQRALDLHALDDIEDHKELRAVANYNLAVIYQNSAVVRRDDAVAFRHFALAAMDNYAPAQFNLGVMYAKGVGTPQDYGKAMTLWQAAADQGNAGALYDMSVLYENGWGVKRDPVKAADLQKQARAKGFKP